VNLAPTLPSSNSLAESPKSQEPCNTLLMLINNQNNEELPPVSSPIYSPRSPLVASPREPQTFSPHQLESFLAYLDDSVAEEPVNISSSVLEEIDSLVLEAEKRHERRKEEREARVSRAKSGTHYRSDSI